MLHNRLTCSADSYIKLHNRLTCPAGKLARRLPRALVLRIWQSDLDSDSHWLGVSVLSLSQGPSPSLADWVTFLSWPVTRSRPLAPDLVIKRVALSRAQVFQVQQEAAWRSIESGQRKWSLSCVATKFTKIFVVQILYRPVCTAQYARHEGSSRCFPYRCNRYFLNWNSTCAKLPKNFAAAKNRNIFWCSQWIIWCRSLGKCHMFLGYESSHDKAFIFQWLNIEIGWWHPSVNRPIVPAALHVRCAVDSLLCSRDIIGWDL